MIDFLTVMFKVMIGEGDDMSDWESASSHDLEDESNVKKVQKDEEKQVLPFIVALDDA